MNNLIFRLNDISRRKLQYYSPEQVEAAQEALEEWKDNPNKHEVSGFYQDSLFCVLYVRDLYQCRVSSFSEVLSNLWINEDVRNLMGDTTNIVSIGCGPGPEIGAYVDFVRKNCSKESNLNILALDAVVHWKDFIFELEDSYRNIRIQFQNTFVDSSFLVTNSLKGVCLMSYPESINFDTNFWNILKNKFDLVIIADQSKQNLHYKLIQCNYNVIPFQFKGSKHYAFHIRPQKIKAMAQAGRAVSITVDTKIVMPDIPVEEEEEGFWGKYCTIV